MNSPQNAAAAPAESPPESLSGHRILSEIGSGGMGQVWLAEDIRLGRKVAIKVLQLRYRDDVELRHRFMQEARALARLSHPNIVHIYNLGVDHEAPHFVMEYLEGGSFSDAVRALSLTQRVEVFHRVLRAVAFLHSHHIIHRDLKPSNVKVGSDLEPKLLDFGLAKILEDVDKTPTGELLGTPGYLAPEQIEGNAPVDARTDIFALGVMLYELLTGVLPFRGDSIGEQFRRVVNDDPIIPRRLNPAIPGELQNICLKALEKRAADRYATAQEMVDDMERYLAGDPVIAVPTYYARVTAQRIEQHVRELDGWKQDQIISEYEYDALRRGYDRLIEREDAWLLEMRRLSWSQVVLYLGAWILVVAAALLFLFEYHSLRPWERLLLVATATVPTFFLGIHLWRGDRVRIAIAYLLTACLLLPVSLLVLFDVANILAYVNPDRKGWELFERGVPDYRFVTNAQLWWALAASLPLYSWLRRFTRSSVFSLVLAVALLLLVGVTLARWGLRDWIDHDQGQIYLRLLPFAVMFFIIAIVLERSQLFADSRYFYPIAVLLTLTALTGIVGQYEPYAKWLNQVLPWTRGQEEYLYILNGVLFYGLQAICERFQTPQMRAVAKAFRFVVPYHILWSLASLSFNATSNWGANHNSAAAHFEARFYEILLPLSATAFVLVSVPKQMKNYIASGLAFVAIGIVNLQTHLFVGKARLPMALIVVGLSLMILAINYTSVRATLLGWLRHRRLDATT